MENPDVWSADVWGEDAARTYDAENAGMTAPEVLEPALDRLVELAEGGPVLELAIGTGRVAVPLTGRGVAVSGIELSAPMVAQLRTKADAERIPVVVGDMAHATVPGEFALVYLVFNIISNLLEQSEQVACFRNAAAHLPPGGRFVIELGVPDLRRLPPDRTAAIFETGPDRIGLDTYDVVAQHLVSHHFRFGDATDARLFRSPPLRLARGARPDGAARRLRPRAPMGGLGPIALHGPVRLARVGLPARDLALRSHHSMASSSFWHAQPS